MKVPKNIEKYARKYVSTGKRQYAQKVIKWLVGNTNVCEEEIIELYVASRPSGKLQNRDEYCQQWSVGYDDDFRGYYYHRFANSRDYLKYFFET